MLQCTMNASKVEKRSRVFIYLSTGTGIAHLSPRPFTVDVEMWTWDLRAVRVPVWRAVQIEPHKDDRLPRPALISGFR